MSISRQCVGIVNNLLINWITFKCKTSFCRINYKNSQIFSEIENKNKKQRLYKHNIKKLQKKKLIFWTIWKCFCCKTLVDTKFNLSNYSNRYSYTESENTKTNITRRVRRKCSNLDNVRPMLFIREYNHIIFSTSM